MDVSLITAILILVILAYYFIYCSYDKPAKTKLLDPEGGEGAEGDLELDTEKDMTVIMRSTTDKYYVAVNRLTRHLYLTEDKARADEFTIISDRVHKKSPKIFLMLDDGYYVNLKYTPFSKKEYDVRMNVNEKINTARLKLSKSSKGIYIKFSNGFYLTIFEGSLYSCKDKSRIFYFKFLSP